MTCIFFNTSSTLSGSSKVIKPYPLDLFEESHTIVTVSTPPNLSK